MPILFMGLMAFALLVIMGFLLFFAVWKESRQRHGQPQAPAPKH